MKSEVEQRIESWRQFRDRVAQKADEARRGLEEALSGLDEERALEWFRRWRDLTDLVPRLVEAEHREMASIRSPRFLPRPPRR